MSEEKKIFYYVKKEPTILVLTIIFGILFNLSQIFNAIMLGRLIDAINDGLSFNIIFRRIFQYLGVILLIQIFRFGKRLFSRKLSNHLKINLRETMYTHLINEPIEVIMSENMGNIMVRIIGDADLVAEGFNKGFTEIFDTGLYMITYFTALMLYDVKTTLLASIFIPISMGIAYLLKTKIYKASKIYRDTSGDVANESLEYITNALMYRNYGSIDSIYLDYEESLEDLRKKNIKADMLEGSMQPIYRSISYLGVIFVIFFGAKNVETSKDCIFGVWSVGIFSAYLKLFADFVKKSSMVGKTINAVSKAKISWQRIVDYLSSNKRNIIDSKPTGGDLEVSNLSFSYGKENIINNISFKARKGEIIGVTGPIASGKSTLGKALLGLFNYKGDIKLGGIELREYSKEEKSKLISYMGHDPYLLSDTIYNNIDLGDKLDIKEVLDDTRLSVDLLQMKDGINSYVGSGGIMLSGGQQARIALSRALLHKNNLIILDDPFSACDMKTEEEIIFNLKNKYKDSIIILISHRLTIFPYTSKVIMLEDGYKIASHEEMLEISLYYRRIFNIQKGGDDK